MPIIIKFQKAKDQFFKSVKYPEENYARYMGGSNFNDCTFFIRNNGDQNEME